MKSLAEQLEAAVTAKGRSGWVIDYSTLRATRVINSGKTAIVARSSRGYWESGINDTGFPIMTNYGVVSSAEEAVARLYRMRNSGL